MTKEQEQFSTYLTSEHGNVTFVIDPLKILELKNPTSETKPFLKLPHHNLTIIKP